VPLSAQQRLPNCFAPVQVSPVADVPGADALSVFVAFFVLNGAVFSLQRLFVGSRSLLVWVLEAMVVLVDGAVITLLVPLSLGTALGLLPDLFPQIRFKRCLLRLRR